MTIDKVKFVKLYTALTEVYLGLKEFEETSERRVAELQVDMAIDAMNDMLKAEQWALKYGTAR